MVVPPQKALEECIPAQLASFSVFRTFSFFTTCLVFVQDVHNAAPLISTQSRNMTFSSDLPHAAGILSLSLAKNSSCGLGGEKWSV